MIFQEIVFWWKEWRRKGVSLKAHTASIKLLHQEFERICFEVWTISQTGLTITLYSACLHLLCITGKNKGSTSMFPNQTLFLLIGTYVYTISPCVIE